MSGKFFSIIGKLVIAVLFAMILASCNDVPPPPRHRGRGAALRVKSLDHLEKELTSPIIRGSTCFWISGDLVPALSRGNAISAEDLRSLRQGFAFLRC